MKKLKGVIIKPNIYTTEAIAIKSFLDSLGIPSVINDCLFGCFRKNKLESLVKDEGYVLCCLMDSFAVIKDDKLTIFDIDEYLCKKVGRFKFNVPYRVKEFILKNLGYRVLLGMFNPNENYIMLFTEGIEILAKKRKVSTTFLTLQTFMHEFLHLVREGGCGVQECIGSSIPNKILCDKCKNLLLNDIPHLFIGGKHETEIKQK